MLRSKIVLGRTAVDLNGLTRSSGKSSLPIVHTTEKQVYSSEMNICRRPGALMASNKITRTHVQVSVREMRDGSKSHVLHLRRNSAGIGCWVLLSTISLGMILNRREILKRLDRGVKELGAEYANVLFLFPFMKNSCAQAHAVGFRRITMAPPMLESAQRRR